jgi:hypothetical protein
MAVFSAELDGMDQVKAVFATLARELSPKETRAIVSEAGRVVVTQARREVPWHGMIGEYFKRDLGVYRDRGSAGARAEYVLVGPRFKSYTIHGQDQKVATIAQHMAQGFRQTDRRTRSKGIRGRVIMQEPNPVLGAYRHTQSERQIALNKGVNKQLKKIASKYPQIVKTI